MLNENKLKKMKVTSIVNCTLYTLSCEDKIHRDTVTCKFRLSVPGVGPQLLPLGCGMVRRIQKESMTSRGGVGRNKLSYNLTISRQNP